MKSTPLAPRLAPTLLLAFTLLTLPLATVQADDISYTYVDGHVQQADPDFGDSNLGYRFEASLGLPLNFYGIASWERADIDDLPGDLDAADLGVGWHIGLGDTVHGLAELTWSKREVGLLDEDGYTLSVGARVAPGERWEFGAKAGYRDLDSNLEGGFGEAYVLWKVWGVLGLSARAELAEEANRIGVGARISF
jgi:hypothetical protein